MGPRKPHLFQSHPCVCTGETQTCSDPTAFAASLNDYFSRLKQAKSWDDSQYSNASDALSAILELVRKHDVSFRCSNQLAQWHILWLSISATVTANPVACKVTCTAQLRLRSQQRSTTPLVDREANMTCCACYML